MQFLCKYLLICKLLPPKKTNPAITHLHIQLLDFRTEQTYQKYSTHLRFVAESKRFSLSSDRCMTILRTINQRTQIMVGNNTFEFKG